MELERLKPTALQLSFMDWKMGAFFHFGIRTFYEGHRDWDGRPMPAAGFNPTRLDCGQWMRAIKAAGMTYAILTCKHHDGFANWPTRSSDYSVASSAWENGRGDVVRAFTDACRTYGIKVGLYYSPADAAMKTGARTAREHDDFFVSQITELLSNYGRIDYLWFDGCGSEGHSYDTERIVRTMRTLQPEMLLFGMWDHDVRWIGNEQGFAPPDFDYLASFAADDSTFPQTDQPVVRFLPAECDFRLRAKNWFYSDCDQHTVKSVAELMGIYDYSVGRGCNFLMNIAPDRNGLLPEVDVRRLDEFGQALRNRFARPIAAEITCEQERVLLTFASPELAETLVLEEDLAEGQSVAGYQVFFTPGYGQGPEPVEVCRGASIGHKHIIRLPSLYAGSLEIRLSSRPGKTACLKQVGVFR